MVDERSRAIEDIYRERYARFRDVLASLTGSREAAHDAVQETFAQAIRDRASFRGDGSLEAWIWRIALRTVQRQRSHLASSAGATAGSNGTGVAAVPWSSLDPELAEAVRALPPRQRLIVFLRYFADLSYAQIAETASVTEGTVAATLAQARAALLDSLTAKEHPG